MSLHSPDLRRLVATLAIAAVVLLTLVSVAAAADETISAARVESFSAAQAKCAKKLRQSCYSQRLWHIARGRCWVFRGVVTGRVGRTYGCPGSPLYVW